MASAALADSSYSEARPGRSLVERYRPVESPKYVGDERALKPFDTKLGPNLIVETTVPPNPKFVEALFKLHELKALPLNWDGYGAQRVNERAFRPALALIIQAVNRCHAPAIVPLSDGGLGLRWEEAGKALELDVLPDCKIEVFMGGEKIGDDLEPEEPIDLDTAQELVCRYTRA